MAYQEKSGGSLPSYDEIFKTPEAVHSKGQQILDQLTLVRSQHVRSVVDEQILPVLEEQAMYGIAKFTIALLPSDIEMPLDSTSTGASSEFSFGSSSTPPQILELVGFPSDEIIQQIRLTGQLNRLFFWHQPAVITELRNVLQDRLGTTGICAASSLQPAPAPVPATVSPPQNLKAQKKGFWGRRSGAASSQPASPPPTAPPTVVNSPLQSTVNLETITLRTLTEFGLYETITRSAIVIRFVASC